jgi:predicted amidophosphoribosyltransferase
MAGAGNALLSVLLPADCRLCEGLLTRASRVPICDDCLASFRALPQRVCDVWGWPLGTPFATNPAGSRPVSGQEREGLACTICPSRTFAFDPARSYAAHDGAVVRAIVMLKFERMEPLGAWSAERLWEMVKREGSALAADVVVPVPLDRRRERERGYNQADLVARRLAKRLGLPYRAVLLLRTPPPRQTGTQPLRALGVGPWRFCHAS